jgi:hypothetical protein
MSNLVWFKHYVKRVVVNGTVDTGVMTKVFPRKGLYPLVRDFPAENLTFVDLHQKKGIRGNFAKSGNTVLFINVCCLLFLKRISE